MRHTKITAFIALTALSAFLLVLSFTPPAGGETHAASSAAVDVQAPQAPTYDFPESVRAEALEMLASPYFDEMSSAGQMAVERRAGARKVEGIIKRYDFGPSSSFVPVITDVTEPPTPNPSSFVDPLTNDPAADTTARNTQSETTIVLASGTNVVSAFNDSGSNVAGANKFTGFSTSANSGTSWTDRGTLPTAAGNGDAGDPILARNNTTGTILFGTLNFNVPGQLNIYRSTDQGVTFGAAINGTPGGGSQDKEWLTVDNFAGPGNGNAYLFWRNFAGGGGMTITRSTDDGLTWGNRQVLAAASGQGAQVAVGPDHSVYAQWFATNQIVIRRSTDQGLTFAPLTVVTPILSTGVNGDLGLGAFRSSAFPQLVVNPVSGTLYTVYPDNPAGADRADVFFRQSTDNGTTWSAAVRVNTDAGTNDNWMPTLAVTPDGTALFVGMYDRRRSATNNRIEYWGRTATISGSTVTFGCNFPISSSDFPVVVGVDPAINTVYMGDYDQAVADNNNFYVTWGDNRLGNPDVRFALVPKAGVTSTASLALVSQNVTGTLQSNSCNDLNVTVGNEGCAATAGAVTGTLTTSTPGVSLFNATQSFGAIAQGGTGTNAAPFQVSLASSFVCGTTIAATLTMSNGDVIPVNIPTQGVGYQFTTSTGPIVPGTTNIGNSTDDGTTFVALPFTFSYYGTPFTGANVSSNGNLQFTSNSTAFTNVCPLPFATFNNPIMGHWDDLLTNPQPDCAGYPGGQCGIFTSTTGVAPNRVFNIEWRTTHITTDLAVNFEIRLYETSGQIDFVYGVVNGSGSSASVGLQKGTGSGGPNDTSTFSCNTSSLTTGLIISWTFASSCPQGAGPCLGGTPGPSPTPATPTPTPPATPSPTIIPSPSPTATATVAPSGTPGCTPVTVSYSGAPVAVPDNNTTGVNLVVAVAGVGTITDLDFRFDGTVSSPDPLSTTVGVNHSWVGDMIFRLTSPGGTTVTFYDRPGVPASTFGCSSNNLFALTLDDEAGSALEGQCPGGTDAGPLTGSFTPNNPLSAFDGQNPNGNWTLTAIDAAGGDVGTVRAFSLIFGGACGTPPPSPSPGTPSPTPSATCPTTITHSSSQAITPLNSVSCNNASGHTDNSYWRAFNMNTFVGGAEYNVTSVSFGVEEATGAGGTQPVTVRLYTNAGGAFPGGTRTQIATTTIQVLDSASGTVLNVPIVANVPAGTSELVMEVFTPNGQATGNFFFIGSNTAAETGPSYLSAADCGIATPTDTATIGFPDMNIVFNVLGSCVPGGTPTPSPSATPTCPPSWSAGANFPTVGVIRAVGNYFPANGMFYAMGGRTSDTAGSDLINPFEYDPALNTWTMQAAAYPDNQVNNMACGVLTVSGVDQIYCVGGSAAGATTATARVFSYNPVTDTITALTAADNWPGNVGGTILPGGFAVAGNKLYVIGGFNITADATNETWEFDPNAAVGSRWLARANLPVARGYVPATTIGGLIYTGGGAAITAATLTDTVESFTYNPGTNTWAPIANMPRATGETRAVAMNGEMWVLGGGRVAPNPSNQVDIYNPGTDTWSTGLPFANGRRNFPADSDGTGRIWLAGGYDITPAVVNTTQVFGQGVCPTPTPSPTPGTPTPTPTGTPGTPSPTATASASATASPSATVPGGSPSPTASPAQAVNFSTRMFVRTGDQVGIGGFIVRGIGPKNVIVRAIGPTLSQNGVPDPLADPVLELRGSGGFTTIINNNWRDTQEQEIQDTGLPPTNDFESAIVASLPPGEYTGLVRGNGNTVGVALIEVYDLDFAASSRLANISTRAFVSTGDDVVIAGFILGNNGGDDNVIVRGLGPSLSALGVPTVLANPTLDMRNANGTLVFTNNDWQDNPTQAGIIAAAGLAPSDPLEAAIAATLPPDLYTVLLAGLNKVVGNGLVEVYDLANGDPFPTPTPGISPTPVPSPTVTPGASPSPGVSPSPAASATPSPAASPSPSPPAGNCTENFDGGSSLPAGWVATNDQGPPPLWAISTTNPDTPPNDAFVSDTSVISDKRLDTRPIVIGGGPAQLTFRNFYDFEYDPPPAEVFWDGGVLEVSINGGPFLDVIDPGIGGSFVSGGYNGVIDDSANNPLAAQQAWGANTAGAYINSVVNLGPNVVGQSIVLRFRMGTDEAIGAPGWRIDTLVVTGGSCP